MKAKCLTTIFLPLFCFTAFAENAASDVAGNSDDITSAAAGLLILLALASVPLSLVGAFLGIKGKLIIYHGKSDLHLTCWITLLLVTTGVCFTWVSWLGFVASLLVFCFLILSFKKSYRANGSRLKATLSLITKFALLCIMIFCGLIALAGAATVMDAAKKKDEKKAIQGAAMTVGGGIGFHNFKNLIYLLVKENSEISKITK